MIVFQQGGSNRPQSVTVGYVSKRKFLVQVRVVVPASEGFQYGRN